MTAEVKVGDQVWVHRMRREPFLADVVKVARVWVTLRDPDAPHWSTMRLRLDTQSDGSGFTWPMRFCTREQHEREQLLHAARDILRRHGIGLDFASPWLAEDALVALASWVDSHPPTPESAQEDRGPAESGDEPDDS
jgi:hypothetical protein